MSQQHPSALHTHAPPPHILANANHVHRTELAQAGAIDKAIMWINDKTATVHGIIIFFGIGICSLVGYLTGNLLLGVTFGALSSYVLQLVYLALLMYAGKKSDRAREIQSDQIYQFSENTAHHMQESMHHLDAQDVHILSIEQQHGEKLDRIIALLSPPPTATPPPPDAPPAPAAPVADTPVQVVPLVRSATPAPLRNAKGQFVKGNQLPGGDAA